jgi:molybdopterin synthase sulfur carrier subunit
MSCTIRIPTQLRNLTNQEAAITVDGATVGEALKALAVTYDGFSERLFDEAGHLRRFVNVFLADEDIRFLEHLDTKVTDGQTISIVPAVAGG